MSCGKVAFTHELETLLTCCRLFLWYTVLTTLFRCPSTISELSDKSPQICKPYLQAKSYVWPYVQPHYDQYLAPHVEKLQPHIDRVNRQVYQPASAFAQKNYQTYAAPRVEQLQVYSQQEWDRTVRPQIELAQSKANEVYQKNLAPHVSKASEAAAPYYSNARVQAEGVYSDRVKPAYDTVKPYAEHGYTYGQYAMKDVILPYLQQAELATMGFLSRSIWPQLRILYGENVEPQLTRISERLGRYKDSKKLEAVAESVDASSSVASVIDKASSISSSAAASSSTIVTSSSASAKPTLSENEVREKIANDLKTWQEKFAKAADKGSEDLEERVAELTARQIESQARGTGAAFLTQLEETSTSVMETVKSAINTLVKNLPEDASDQNIEDAYEQALGAVRSAGLAVREKAQDLRGWKQNYQQETYSLVKAASDSTLDVIDNIRDLGLQEIGMRWAWMDGVTYKDWQKYHALKKQFDDWRTEVEEVAMKHDGLKKAMDEGEDIESKGMAIAEKAANELGRLKDVARWKLVAQDSTDDFSTKAIPARAAKVAQKVVDAVEDKVEDASSAVLGTSQGTVESASSVASASVEQVKSSASSAASEMSQSVLGEKPTTESIASAVSSKAKDVSEKVVGAEQPTIESVASVASEKVVAASSVASEAVIGSEPGMAEKASSKASEAVVGPSAVTDSVASSASSVKSRIADKSVEMKDLPPKAQSVLNAAKYKTDQAKESIKGTPAPSDEPLLSKASSSASSIASAASDAVSEASAADSGSVSSASSAASSALSGAGKTVSSSASSVSSVASEAVSGGSAKAQKSAKKVMGGAMAQVLVEAREPILDDDVVDEEKTYSERLQKAINNAGVNAAQLTEAISEAMTRPTSTQGAMESVTSLASEQYERALSAASSVLYGSETPATESATNYASQKYAEAVTA